MSDVNFDSISRLRGLKKYLIDRYLIVIILDTTQKIVDSIISVERSGAWATPVVYLILRLKMHVVVVYGQWVSLSWK